MTSGGSPRFSLRRALPMLLIAACAAAGFWLFGDVLSFDTLRDNREALIAWRDSNLVLAAVAYCAIYVVAVALSLPGAAVMTMAGGFLFGVVWGTGLTVGGATLGALLVFLAARHGFGDALHARLRARGGSGALARIERGLSENQMSFLFLIRLVPVVPFFVANLAPALFGVSARLFVLTTFLGIIPGSAVYSWIGSGLGAVFARGESPDLSLLTDPVVWGPLLGLAALAALPIVLRPLLARVRAR
jgi:uncharacterized membrane protein YdjX (TVP38/TMEM64 family)